MLIVLPIRVHLSPKATPIPLRKKLEQQNLKCKTAEVFKFNRSKILLQFCSFTFSCSNFYSLKFPTAAMASLLRELSLTRVPFDFQRS